MSSEIRLANKAYSEHNRTALYLHLGRAHVLSQNSILDHLIVHCYMFQYAFRMRDFKELRGQCLRLVVTIPGHLFGKVPRGNIGWNTVELREEMEVPEDLSQFL